MSLSVEEENLKSILLELLNCIQSGDPEKYKKLVSEDLTCFEPETNGHSVLGLPFHLYFLENSKSPGTYHLELVNPTFRVFDNFAYTSYTLLVTRLVDENPIVKNVNETRIFTKETDTWKMIHFHRS